MYKSLLIFFCTLLREYLIYLGVIILVSNLVTYFEVTIFIVKTVIFFFFSCETNVIFTIMKVKTSTKIKKTGETPAKV